jgi:hypothetical protein
MHADPHLVPPGRDREFDDVAQPCVSASRPLAGTRRLPTERLPACIVPWASIARNATSMSFASWPFCSVNGSALVSMSTTSATSVFSPAAAAARQ